MSSERRKAKHIAEPESGPIRVEVDPDLIDLVPVFLGNRREDVDALREAIRSGDAETVESLGHRMKGMGGGYGFQYVTEAGAEMERAAREGRLDDAGPWIEGLADYLARVEPVEGKPE